MSFLAGWGRRKSKIINGSTAGAQTNFQMQITINKSSGVDTSTNIYVGTNIRDDFGDLRFTTSDGTTLLDYWIETLVSGVSALVWIEVATIPASPSTTTIYIYYDNATETSLSNGANTFAFFDDFTGSSIDTSIWTITNSTGFTVASSELKSVSSTGWLTSINTFSGGIVQETKLRRISNTVNGFNVCGWRGSSTNKLMLLMHPPIQNDYYANDGADDNSFINIGVLSPLSTNLLSQISAYSNNTADIRTKNYSTRANYYSVLGIANTVLNEPIVIKGNVAGQAHELYWDWIRIRKLANPEPTFGATEASAVVNVTSTEADGTYTTGQVIPITIQFEDNITVTGTPQIQLETGATDQQAPYSSGSGSTTITLNYTVQSGDTSLDLDYVATTSLTLNGGTIIDINSLSATLTLPVPGATGSLGANKAIIISAAVTSTPTLGNLYLPIQRGISFIAGLGASLGRNKSRLRS